MISHSMNENERNLDSFTAVSAGCHGFVQGIHEWNGSY